MVCPLPTETGTEGAGARGVRDEAEVVGVVEDGLERFDHQGEATGQLAGESRGERADRVDLVEMAPRFGPPLQFTLLPEQVLDLDNVLVEMLEQPGGAFRPILKVQANLDQPDFGDERHLVVHPVVRTVMHFQQVHRLPVVELLHAGRETLLDGIDNLVEKLPSPERPFCRSGWC